MWDTADLTLAPYADSLAPISRCASLSIAVHLHLTATRELPVKPVQQRPA